MERDQTNGVEGGRAAHRRKGRGAETNRVGRFEAHAREVFDDGWDGLEETAAARLETTLTVDASKTIITRNTSPDVPFDRSINPYRGCEHGCIYCFARPSHAYWGLSPGQDFESRLFWKPDAADLLRRELAWPGYVAAPLALGANTDPYQPVERGKALTRAILGVLAGHRHPVGIVTKAALVARDIDLLAPMARLDLAMVSVSVTTLDRDLARRMEPRAATPVRRLETIRRLSDAGVPVAILASPMIPGLNDHELEAILEAGRDAGATMANTLLVRLPLELRDLFREWLATHAPDRADRVLSLIRQTRGGALYRSEFGARLRGEGPVAKLLGDRFARAAARLGFRNRDWSRLDATRFRVPGRAEQLDLL